MFLCAVLVLIGILFLLNVYLGAFALVGLFLWFGRLSLKEAASAAQSEKAETSEK